MVPLGREGPILVYVAWPQRGGINRRGQRGCRAQEMPLCDPYLVQGQVVGPGGGEIDSQSQDSGRQA